MPSAKPAVHDKPARRSIRMAGLEIWSAREDLNLRYSVPSRESWAKLDDALAEKLGRGGRLLSCFRRRRPTAILSGLQSGVP